MNHPEILGVTFHPSGIAKERKRSLASPAIFPGSSRYRRKIGRGLFRIALNVIFASDPRFSHEKERGRKNRTSLSA